MIRPRVLGDRDEFGGRNFAARRVRPAAERFDADHGLAALVDDRLVQQPQLVVFDRLAQVAFQQLAVGQIRVHRRVVDAGAVAAFVLGAVERHVGVAHDVGGAARIAVDHRDADRGADHDVLAVDRVGRADRGDQALGHRHHLGVVVADRGNHRELVAAEAGHQVVAAQRVRQPQRNAADQFVADRMAERVVDVLEMVEIDIEHGGRRRAGAHLFDHRLQPLAEENAVGQAAERIVHGEMAQPRFAGGDRDGGAAHVAQHESREQREAGERDGNEGDDAAHDFGAGLARRPGKARDRTALRPVELVGQIGCRRRLAAELAQVRQLQLRGDAGERLAVDEFHRHHDRRRTVAGTEQAAERPDRDGGNDSRPARECTDHGGLRMLAVGAVARLGEAERAVQGRVAPAHIGEHRLQIGQRRVGPGRVERVAAELRKDRLVVAVEDENVVVVEVGFQPEPDAPLRPGRIVFDAEILDRLLGGGDALDLAQHALAVVRQRAREQQLLVLDGDFVGALGGGEHGHDDADDGDGNDYADRDHHAQARAIPTRVFFVGCARSSDSRQGRAP